MNERLGESAARAPCRDRAAVRRRGGVCPWCPSAPSLGVRGSREAAGFYELVLILTTLLNSRKLNNRSRGSLDFPSQMVISYRAWRMTKIPFPSLDRRPRPRLKAPG